MPFAQLVIGAPGAGKSTYCDGMHQFLGAIGRKSSVVNLDPANDLPSYGPKAATADRIGDGGRGAGAGAGAGLALDIRDLVTLEEIMEAEELGPNGGVLYAMEELEAGWEWLERGLRGLGDDYVLFDCPGQVEVFTHHESLRRVVLKIQGMGYRLVAVHLTDSYCLTLPSLYISSLLLSLRAMLQMDLPHVNVLTKIDKLASYGRLPFNLDFYTEVHDLNYLLPELSAESTRMSHPKFERLNSAIVELVEDFALVAYETLAVEDKKSMMTLLHAIDRAGGYAFGSTEGANDTVWQVAMREGFQGMTVQDVQERWIDRKEEFDEKERKEWEEQAKMRHQQAEEMAVDVDEDPNAAQTTSNGVKFRRV